MQFKVAGRPSANWTLWATSPHFHETISPLSFPGEGSAVLVLEPLEAARIEPEIRIFREVSHRRMTAVSEPSAVERLVFRELSKPGESNENEALLSGGSR